MTETTATETAPAPRPSAWGPVMRSPAARLHAGLGVRFSAEAGWELPASYGDPEAERALLRESVAVADITARGKIDVRGRIDAALPVGGDGDLVARIVDDWTMIFTPPGPVESRVRELEPRAGSGAMVTDVTHLYAGFALAGPRLEDLLARLTGWDPSTLAAGEATGAPIAEVRAVVVRPDLAFPALEAYVDASFGRYAWGAILDVVRRLGGGPVGWDALRAEGWA